MPYLLIFAFLAWSFITTKTNASKRLDYRLGLQKNWSLKDGALKFTQQIYVLNPTTEPLTVNSLDLDVYLNNKKIGNTFFINTVKLNAGQDTILNCNCVIPFTNIGTIWNQIKGKGVLVTLDGFIKAIGFNVPIKEEIQIELPKF
jgi:LEA14-like dessication related protein